MVILSHSTNEGITFSIVLTRGFPLSAPKLYLQQEFTNPSLSHYKDLLVHALQREWSYTDTLYEIVIALPHFVGRVLNYKDDPLILQKIGIYHVGSNYEYNYLKELNNEGTFICFEQGEETIDIYVISVTHSHILLFWPLRQPYFQ
jgi:ubiquitin-protein ligase